MSLVKILPPSKADRHWIIPKGNKHIGWLPHSSEYVAIFSTKAPTVHDLKQAVRIVSLYVSSSSFAENIKKSYMPSFR